MTPIPTVYIPTLIGGDRLAACLQALRNQTRAAEVVVADNGTGEGSRNLIENSFPEVTRVDLPGNLGFGSALNRAVAEVGSGPIILLNDDTVPDPRFVESLVDHADQAEMVAAVLVDREDSGLIHSAGIALDQTLMAFDYLAGERVARLEHAPDPVGPSGGGALYSRDAFRAVGGFDERIFLYYEDVDLALRIRQIGGECRLASDSRAVHVGSGTLGPASPRKYAHTGWSRGYLLRRYGILGDPLTTSGALTREAAICAGQLIRDRTLAGLRGRLAGWHSAGGLPAREIPAGTVTRISARLALALRSRSSGDVPTGEPSVDRMRRQPESRREPDAPLRTPG